ncbi:hypothetical protein ACRALDRAFT_1060511 [Sodiomyces alcalophilus JCM 7366]|uniref:uncharacterized protein n=1 Tax=Sodiomyces alcalophilus JCM 7366 TaxID=591952 RepID=UPI0039B4EF46
MWLIQGYLRPRTTGNLPFRDNGSVFGMAMIGVVRRTLRTLILYCLDEGDRLQAGPNSRLGDVYKRMYHMGLDGLGKLRDSVVLKGNEYCLDVEDSITYLTVPDT